MANKFSGKINKGPDAKVNDPAHSHTVNNPAHSHTVNNPGHSHTVNDPGHDATVGTDAPGAASEAPAAEAAPAKANKSIVPSKYAGKYKKPMDELAKFLDDNATTEGTLDPIKLFAICRANGIADAHIEPYEKAVADKAHGASGRARMTLRNRLATIVRKEGGLVVEKDGAKTAIHLAPLATVGAAKAAEEAKAAETQAPATEDGQKPEPEQAA